MRGLLHIRFMGALVACACAAIAAAPVSAQGSYSPYNETPAAALARYVHLLADDPKDFGALIGAGKSALELGDTQAAAGFFARADEVNPRSPLPQAGMGAVQVANGNPQGALPYFARAQQLGAPLASFACERGLAYDLLGRQTQAQADYRAALGGLDSDETRRRLALSLAISGDRAGALATLAPLMAKGDAGAERTRAFVLALTGDSADAMTAINAAMPGSSASVAPFLQRLPTLPAGQKAAAVNLGIFPDSSGPAYAYAAPPKMPSTISVVSSVTTDRLQGVDALLQSPQPRLVQQVASPPPPPPPAVQVAYNAVPQPASVQRSPPVAQHRVWLQLASGPNADALSGEFQRMKSRNRDLFDGIGGYVARGTDRARLVVGPFRGTNDAQIFADDLQSVGIAASQWSNSDSDRIVPLATE